MYSKVRQAMYSKVGIFIALYTLERFALLWNVFALLRTPWYTLERFALLRIPWNVLLRTPWNALLCLVYLGTFCFAYLGTFALLGTPWNVLLRTPWNAPWSRKSRSTDRLHSFFVELRSSEKVCLSAVSEATYRFC